MTAPDDLADLGSRGLELWTGLVDDVPEPRRILLLEAARLADRLDRLHLALADQLDTRLLAEARNSQLALARILTDLGSGRMPKTSKDSRLDDLAARRARRQSGEG